MNFITSVNVGYGIDTYYANQYSYDIKMFKARYKWKPFLAGLVIQNKKIELKFFISSNEENFNDKNNISKLRELVMNVDDIQNTIGASKKTYSGILPSVLFKYRIIRSMQETEVVIKCICKSIDLILKMENYSCSTPIVVLGGNGYIGRRVIKYLAQREVYNIDINSSEKVSDEWPVHLKNQKVILVNISKKSALEHYILHVWPNMVLINEVYPEPSTDEVMMYRKVGGLVYHIAGVKGKAIPSYPGAYANAIPCCVAWIAEDIEVVVRKL